MLGPESTNRARTILLLMVVSLCFVAYTQRWLQDDAYITFRYSRNLAEGQGRVWNAGDPVEAYTNFLWMLLLAGASRAGLSIPTASYVLSLPCFAVSLVLVHRIACIVLRDDRWSLVATGLVGTNYSFLMYATGGLETELNVTLTLLALHFVIQALHSGKVTAAGSAGVSVS